MTVLAQERSRRTETWRYKTFTLTGVKAFKGAFVLFDPTTNKVVIGKDTAAAGLILVGTAYETVDATSADKDLVVDLGRELALEWFANATSTDAVASTDVLRTVYVKDDNTVTVTPTAHAVAGRVWAVDSNRGVLIERLESPSVPTALLPTVGAFTAADYAPSDIINGAIYDVPTTAANSTITLPAAAKDGTIAFFVADGTKNGHTITYRDATGPTALTAALTASKRHGIGVVKREGKWFALGSTVSP